MYTLWSEQSDLKTVTCLKIVSQSRILCLAGVETTRREFKAAAGGGWKCGDAFILFLERLWIFISARSPSLLFMSRHVYVTEGEKDFWDEITDYKYFPIDSAPDSTQLYNGTQDKNTVKISLAPNLDFWSFMKNECGKFWLISHFCIINGDFALRRGFITCVL